MRNKARQIFSFKVPRNRIKIIRRRLQFEPFEKSPNFIEVSAKLT
jgi:hypothetical protein